MNISYKTLIKTLCVALIGGATLCSQANAQAPLTEIKVSYQPSLYWALPFYVATQEHWWAELGLKPEFSIFPAGVPQMAAAASKSWDVGGTGSVPAVLGFVRFGVKTIGISNDESDGNALMVSKADATKFRKDPSLMKGQTILLTSNSTGDYAVQSCLKKYGLSKSDVIIKNMGQAEIISALSSGSADLAGLWAPNTYTVEEKSGAVQLCSGKDSGAIVPGALVARSDYAKEHPENVAKFLAIYLRAWSWMSAHRPQALVMMHNFYKQGGVTISDSSQEKEFSTRPTFNLEQQLAIMNSANGPSEADKWFGNIAKFMNGTGSIQSVPASSAYVTDVYMKRVAADPKLRAFANSTK
ncbi:MAG: nitrate ABC transporter substrate-binding protein [Burkholderiaceae bacterium]|nr:MAG: nitrate ABC transporter substrate-binding protein [Burkholderiaceae bacterium]TBR76616.1 MAG: nitrate ABC transporter substrate-binding protein [Burkholderiaceae bacterium]